MNTKIKSEIYKELLIKKDFNKLIYSFKQDYIDLFVNLLNKKNVEFDKEDGTFNVLAVLVAENYPELQKYILYIRGILFEQNIEAISILEDMLDTYLYINKKYNT